MVVITPIVIHIDAAGENDQTEQYFLDRLIRSNKNDFKKIGISQETIENIQKIIETEMNGISEQLQSLLENSHTGLEFLFGVEYFKDILNSISSDNIYLKTSKHDVMVAITSYESFIIISKNKAIVDVFVSKLEKDFAHLGEITKDFGLRYLGFFRGNKYADYVLRQILVGIDSFRLIHVKMSLNKKL